MKNILFALLIIAVLFFPASCKKTGIIDDDNLGKTHFNDTATYSEWLITNFSVNSFGVILTVEPAKLTTDVITRGMVLVFSGPAPKKASPTIIHESLRRSGGMYNDLFAVRLFFTCQEGRIAISDSLVSHTITSVYDASYYIPTIRYFIIPPSIKQSGDLTGIDWNDYSAVTTFLNVTP